MTTASKPLTVAVTGPTGDIGRAFIRALERSREVGEIRGMARRPFDPAAHGWRKTIYRQGDILDPAALAELVRGADVVVHLAFVILGGPDETRRVNLEGSRRLFEATVNAEAKRLVYTSSVAAYGFHADNPDLLTEDVPARGTERHYYSAQKAELEGALAEALAGSATDPYVFRPSIVAGADALALIREIPYVRAGERLPAALRRVLGALPLVRPLLPDTGTPIQLVHHDDVATALRAAVLGRGEPGTYNLGAEGTVSMSDLAAELGWHAVRVPSLAVDAAVELIARLPERLLPPEAAWIEAVRIPMVMDCSRARRALRWRPAHDSASVMREMVSGARAAGLV